MERRKFTREFKLEAVKLIRERGVTVAQTSRHVLKLMNGLRSNIEAVARYLCERQLRAAGTSSDEFPSAVDRYWHCVAAELEAGLIDESGNRLLPHDFERDLKAYRDWRRRHLICPRLRSHVEW